MNPTPIMVTLTTCFFVRASRVLVAALFVTALFVTCLGSSGCQRAAPQSWPGETESRSAGDGPIVLITIEALPWAATQKGWTPNLVRLAEAGESGVAIAASSALLPALEALHTGMPPDAQPETAPVNLPGGATTIAELLSGAGWTGQAFVSGPGVLPGSGLGQGFSVFEGRGRWVKAIEALSTADDKDFFWIHLSRARPPWRRSVEPSSRGGALARRNRSPRPITNLQVQSADPGAAILMRASKFYEQAVRSMDQQVGSILDAIERRDQVPGSSQSRIVVVGSNGASLPSIGLKTPGSGYGVAQDLGRNQIEVPLVLSFRIEAFPNRPVPAYAVASTLLDLAGIGPGPGLRSFDETLAFSSLALGSGVHETSVFDSSTYTQTWTRTETAGDVKPLQRSSSWAAGDSLETNEPLPESAERGSYDRLFLKVRPVVEDTEAQDLQSR